ncbi:MAG: sulfatase [Candidatus Hydrogenedentota bacterium]
MRGTISRRTAMCQMAATGASALALGSRAVENEPKRPNLLIIISDDHNFRALGCAGNREIRTPVLDSIAAEGTRFSHCFVSNPICTPSRACVQTGQYGFHNAVNFFGQKIAPEAPRLARLLSEAGYTCGYTGKWHNDQRPVHHGFARMKNVFLGGMNNYDSIPVVQGADDPKAVMNGHPTEIFTDGAIDLLTNLLPEPWCLFVCYTAPHDPRVTPPGFENEYPVDAVSLPPNFMPQPLFDPGTLDIRDELLLPRPLDPEAIKIEIGRYYAMIAHVDRSIGRIVDHLKQANQWENTVVMFGGDNGLTLGSHGLLGKQTLYEEGVRVPCIVRGPGVRQGAVSGALVDLMDFMPTACDYAGVPLPASVDGKSLRGLAEGTAESVRDDIFCHYDDLFRMVRTDRYKLVLHLKSGREELFDLREDPFELTDRSADANFSSVLNELRTVLAGRRTSAGESVGAQPVALSGTGHVQ